MQSWTIRANVWTIQSNDGFTMPNIKFTLRIQLTPADERRVYISRQVAINGFVRIGFNCG